MIGATHSTSDADIDYSSGTGSPIEGWVDGEFHGDVYNTLDSLNLSSSFGGNPTNNPMPDLTSWPNSLSGDDSTFIGTALLGYNFQHGNLVLGGEFRASFGDFGASDSKTWSDSGTTSGSLGITNESANFTYTNYGNVLDPSYIGPGFFFNNEGASYEATYHQNARIDAQTQFDVLLSPVARLGFAVDRFQLFVMGGPSYANVEASTSAKVDESTSNASTIIQDTTRNFSADKSYSFSGSNSESRWGYTVGGGAEWAVTDHVILRVEGEYHDLGSISVTGRLADTDTDATYRVKQDLNGYSVSTGVSFKF